MHITGRMLQEGTCATGLAMGIVLKSKMVENKLSYLEAVGILVMCHELNAEKPRAQLLLEIKRVLHPDKAGVKAKQDESLRVLHKELFQIISANLDKKTQIGLKATI